MSLLPYALRAAGRGFHIFPCAPGEKTPHLIWPNKPWTFRWSEHATNDQKQIATWWENSPHANIGVACKQSELLVIDCDVAKEPYQLRGTDYESLHEEFGAYVDGFDVLGVVAKEIGGVTRESLLSTYCVQTGSMGLHIYLRWPAGVKASQASIVKGVLDIRGNGGERGGYVLGAGSVTAKGHYIVENDAPVRPAPGWVVDLCKEQPRRPVDPDKSLLRQPGTGSFGGLIMAVATAEVGNRNEVLHWAACCMRDDGESEERALELLVPPAVDRGLPEREAITTVRSAYRMRGQ